uniref:Uncharacterized protein n=1 Tax=Fagus sylvatica TaxID=28930 RepID=A0A2N9EJD9_FAGSY
MPPKTRQRRNQREVSVHTEHSRAESAVNIQGEDQQRPPPSGQNQEVPPTNLLLELIQNLQQNQSELAEAIKQLKEKDAGTKTPPQNGEENQEKPHQDSGKRIQKEPRLFVRKPPYPAELLKQPYPEKYIAPTFSRFDGRKGSALVHISKAYTWYTTLPPGSVKVWEDMVELFCGKYFQAEEKITLVNLHTTKQASGEDLLRYIHRFRDISLDCYANYEEGELVGLLQKARKTALSVKPHTEKPKEKKNPPQVLTVSTVNNKRKKSNERSFDEAPPPVPCTLEEMKAILDKWVADGIIKLPEIVGLLEENFMRKFKTEPWNYLKYNKRYILILSSSIKMGLWFQLSFMEVLAMWMLDESATASTAMTPTAIKTLQRNPRFRSLFNQLGLNPEARTAATEAIMAIAADSWSSLLYSRNPCQPSFSGNNQCKHLQMKIWNAITFTDEDMEVQYPDHRRPLYLSATINEVGPIVAFTRFHVVDSVVPYHILLGRPWLHKHQLIPSTYHQCVKGRLNGKPIRIAANSAPFDQSESHFVEAALYDEVTPAGEASLAKPIGIPLPKWEEIRDAPGADLRDLLEQKKKRKAEASTSKSQPQLNEASVPEPADAAEPVAADPKISAEEELERSKLKFTQEVKKLLSAGFIKPIQHPRWLSNIVPVKKKNGQIRCCVDFRNLNKACPKDEFPLPNMDLLIDSAAGHAMTLRRLHSARLFGNFYYTVMPFGLKNAGATYQRTMTAMFHDMMHCEIEDYVDDIVVKSKTRGDHFAGKFLGFLVHQRGIDVDPARASAIATMKPPTTHKGAEEFFRQAIIHKKGASFHWSTECQEAFEKVRNIMTKLPTVCAPISGKPLRLYLASNSQAIGALIAQENDNGVEQPIYYVSRTLKDAESRYSGAERSCLALIYASQRLRHYFLAHKISTMASAAVTMKYPGEINEVFLAGLADSVWTLRFDGSSTATSAGAGIVLYKDDGEAVTKSFKFDFPCSNNAAEYEAYLAGLAIAYEMGIKHLRVIGDSNLVVCQARGEFSLKEPSLAPYRALAQKFEARFSTFEIEHAQRNENRYADALATLGSQIAFRRLPGGVLARCISLEEAKQRLSEIHEKTCGDGGATSLYRRLQRLGYFWPNMSAEAAEVQSQCPTCQFHSQQRRGGTLFRKGFHGEPLRCLGLSESQMVMKETHAGECGEHQGKKRLYQCLLTLGYYWPTMKKDAADFVKTCHTCQVQANLIHTHPTSLQNMATPWPFHTWGLDLIGPINPASGGCIWILVATEYFTKWVEAIPLRKATGAAVANFIREHIITRFGIPYKLITDNGTPFINKDVREVLEHYRVKHRRSTPYYPQGNGQAEATNRMLLRILSKMVFDYGNDWKAHLADVLWAYRSSPKTATGFTPFSLVYARMADLEGLDEARDLAKAKAQRNYQKMANVYSKALRVRIFAEGQMVLKAAEFVRRNLPSPS